MSQNPILIITLLLRLEGPVGFWKLWLARCSTPLLHGIQALKTLLTRACGPKPQPQTLLSNKQRKHPSYNVQAGIRHSCVLETGEWHTPNTPDPQAPSRNDLSLRAGILVLCPSETQKLKSRSLKRPRLHFLTNLPCTFDGVGFEGWHAGCKM